MKAALCWVWWGLLLQAVLQTAEVRCGQILSRDISTVYDFSGYAVQFNLPFSLESGLATSDGLRVLWPYSLLDTTKVSATVQEWYSGLQVTPSTPCDASSSVAAALSTLNFLFQSSLQPGVWYVLVLSVPTAAGTAGLKGTPVAMSTLTSFTNGLLIDSTNTFGLVFLKGNVASQTLTIAAVAFPSYNSLVHNPGQTVPYYIDVTTTASYPTGA